MGMWEPNIPGGPDTNRLSTIAMLNLFGENIFIFSISAQHWGVVTCAKLCCDCINRIKTRKTIFTRFITISSNVWELGSWILTKLSVLLEHGEMRVPTIHEEGLTGPLRYHGLGLVQVGTGQNQARSTCLLRLENKGDEKSFYSLWTGLVMPYWWVSARKM